MVACLFYDLHRKQTHKYKHRNSIKFFDFKSFDIEHEFIAWNVDRGVQSNTWVQKFAIKQQIVLFFRNAAQSFQEEK